MESSIFKGLILMQNKINKSEEILNDLNNDANELLDVLHKEINKLNKIIENLKHENEKLQNIINKSEKKTDSTLCLLCFENERNVLFRPCNHLVICDTCSGQTDFTDCIVCKQVINAYEYAYL
jgi:hypothetical protein